MLDRRRSGGQEWVRLEAVQAQAAPGARSRRIRHESTRVLEMTPRDDVALDILRTIRKMVRQISIHSKHLLREVGLSVPQVVCLRAIHVLAGDRGVTVAELSEHVQLSAPTVSRIVDRLITAGLITRERSTEDRRKVALALTPDGAARISALPQPLQDTFLRRLAELSQEERAHLRDALARCEDGRIGEDYDVGGRDVRRPRQQLRRQLGADAVRVAGDEGDAGLAHGRVHSALMFAVRISLPNRSYSCLFMSANWSIVSVPGSPPRPLRRACTSGSFSTRASSACSLSTTGFGVPPVTNNPYHVVISAAG